MSDFVRLTLESKTVLDSYLKNKSNNSESSFANLYIWSDYYHSMYSIVDGFLVILNTSPDGRIHCYMPYGDGDVGKCLDEIKDYIGKSGQPLRITNASMEQAEYIKKRYPNSIIDENRNFEDYMYLSESLASLSGRELHAKRNHLNRFKALYSYNYRELTENDFEECIRLSGEVVSKTRPVGSMGYEEEMRSIRKAFEHFSYLELCGGMIEIDGKIVAYTIGEALNPECALIHIEKADTAYNGIYAAINNEFVKNRWLDYKYINREEDMGLEGLRKAKLSYRPDHLIQKFMCTIE